MAYLRQASYKQSIKTTQQEIMMHLYTNCIHHYFYLFWFGNKVLYQLLYNSQYNQRGK